MSENLDHGARDFSRYDAMATEDLEQILRLDSEAPEGQESDIDLLLYVMGVLASRKNAKTTGNTAQQAWEEFQTYYLNDEDDIDTQEPEVAKPHKKPMLRRVIAAAAVVAILAAFSVAAGAFGWRGIWNAVAQWAKETFSFISTDQPASAPSPSNMQEFASLQQALADTNQSTDMVPTITPERFILDKIVVDETPVQNIYVALYKCGDSSLRISVRAYLNTDPEKVEANEDLIELYPTGGVEYYIFANQEQLRAVWITDSYECYISGDVTIEEMHSMIDSIGKG